MVDGEQKHTCLVLQAAENFILIVRIQYTLADKTIQFNNFAYKCGRLQP